MLSINILQDSCHEGGTALVTFEAADSKLQTEYKSLCNETCFVEFRKIFV